MGCQIRALAKRGVAYAHLAAKNPSEFRDALASWSLFLSLARALIATRLYDGLRQPQWV